MSVAPSDNCADQPANKIPAPSPQRDGINSPKGVSYFVNPNKWLGETGILAAIKPLAEAE